ncbi:hypothetical protein A7E75_03775 [Syntrophotalea acetylenica]|uniref:Type I restriction modification DNA specificity domain-containing protein n=2 Tax=Syntrophotalea acetylenica TaxID=29542 RepID=A0A1L3GE71_SYNAC|nr:hypothetical protein A7E75_03775 [Syntrophotalea acetylenica]
MKDNLESFAPATAQKNINLAVLNNITLKCPPIDEQHEIVRLVKSLFAYADRLEAYYATASAQVECLSPALLAKAFRGELVPQNPEDEPVGRLLERIRNNSEKVRDKRVSRKAVGRPKKTKKAEVIMLNRKNIKDSHLSTILQDRGPLTAEALWSASKLEIDDFYDQLKDEEERGLLKEFRPSEPDGPRLLESAA